MKAKETCPPERGGEGDILIIVPWSFQDERCDIIYRYTGPQVKWLKQNRYL
jgi:translation initiation factor 1A